jgi:hypothetical protein
VSLWLLLTGSALAVLLAAAFTTRRRRPVRLHATVARPCAVYIIPSRTARPAYVGEGYDPYRRIACHRREAPWWHLVDTAREPTIEWLPGKMAARAREQELIGRLAPYGNDRHNHGRGLSHPVGSVPAWGGRNRSAPSSPASRRSSSGKDVSS